MDPIRKISVLRSLVIKSLIDIIFVERLGLIQALLLYHGILSNAVFLKPKTALNFYLTQIFSKFFLKNVKKNCQKLFFQFFQFFFEMY